MAKRPADMDPAEWAAQRKQYWRRVNWTFNTLMVLAIIAVVLRNCV